MTDHERVLIAQFGLVVAIAWFVYAFVYKRTRQDAFRERLYAIRDDLFDYMWKNGLPYDLPAYGLLRSALNGFIRTVQTGDYNLTTFWLRAQALHSQQAVPVNRVARAIGAIEDVGVRDHFKAVYMEVGLEGIKQLVFEGPMSIVLAPLCFAQIYLWAHGHDLGQGSRGQVVEVSAEIDRQERECEAEGLTPQPA